MIKQKKLYKFGMAAGIYIATRLYPITLKEKHYIKTSLWVKDDNDTNYYTKLFPANSSAKKLSEKWTNRYKREYKSKYWLVQKSDIELDVINTLKHAKVKK